MFSTLVCTGGHRSSFLTTECRSGSYQFK